MKNELITEYTNEVIRTTGLKSFSVWNGKSWNRGIATAALYHWGKFNTYSEKRVTESELEQFIATMKTKPTAVERPEMVNGISTLIPADCHVVQNLMSGTDVIESKFLPNCCSVASETYWSM
jgi:hypothetical protein